MVYNLSYNLVGFVFLLTLTMYFLYIPIFPNRSNSWFSTVLIFSTFSVGLDVLTGYTINNSTEIPVALNYTLNTMFFVCYWSLAFVFFSYSVVLTKNESFLKKDNAIKKLFIGLYTFEMLAITSSPFLHTIFYFDENLKYQHGPLYQVCALIALSLIIIAGILVVIRRKQLPLIQRVIIPFYTIFLIVANLIQVLFPYVFVNGAILSLATFIMFLTLQNPTSYYDSLTRTYSRTSFQEYLYNLVYKNTHFQIIIIDIVSTNNINRTFGEDVGNEVISQVAQKILGCCNTKLVFRMDGNSFIIITEQIEKRDEILSKLKREFPFRFENNNYNFNVQVHLNYSQTLYGFENTNEAGEIIKECSILGKNHVGGFINKTSIDEIIRTRKIEKALQNAIESNNLVVYLQPIFSSKSKKCVKAEALVRIIDDELGLVMPSEFIGLAEKNGSISKIAPQILEKVCIFLSTTELPNYFNKISINLSVIDCLNPNLATEFMEIITKNKIDPSRIIFEVTETVASLAPQLEKTMKVLIKEGITFAIDDFGTGYANLDSVIKLPFSIVKIDRQLLQLIHDIRYKVLLEGIIDILNHLNLESVIEGIETEFQADSISKMGGTYQQGYFYSKPVNLSNFMKLINQN